MNKITICNDTLDISTWETFDCGDIRPFLYNHFKGQWPDTARIYQNYVAESADVTPHDDGGVNKLGELTGHFYVVVYPDGWVLALVIISIVLTVASVALSFLLRPKAPVTPSQTSPNGLLSNRSNTARPNERIPDIYGEVWSVPDYIAVAYDVFDSDGIETEYSYFCIGRGSYTIEQVRENTTEMSLIPGVSVEVYAPFTSPNSGGTPQLRIGPAINTPVYNVIPCSSINGQDMYAPNQTGTGIAGPPYWQGPYFIVNAATTQVWCNFVAEGGCYTIDNSGVQSAYSVSLEVGITPCDGAGNPTGAEQTFNGTLTGSANLKNACGVTIKCAITGGATAVKIRSQRTSNTLITSGTEVVDSVQWKDAYSIAPVTLTNFGDVTTVQVITQPTPAALAIQERKLNILVTRNLPQYQWSGTPGVQGTYSTTLYPTKNAVDILAAAALDPYIGNRQLSELDTDDMYDALQTVATYFGTTKCVEFCYTFSDANQSFEEMAADVAQAVFCTCYRQGSLISLFFEQLNPNSVLLFNHRNKMPGSETRTITFGTQNDNDGIQLTYIDPYAPNYPAQDTSVTLYYPADGSAKNPNKITTVGIRNNVQAALFGWRLYQRLILQNTVVEFDALMEAATIGINERILVADNTRPDTQDGEVLAQNALLLTLSQPVTFKAGLTYTIFVQHPDKTVEAIGVVAGPQENQVILATAPSQPLVVAAQMYARTTYIITNNGPMRSAAFLLAEKTPEDGGLFKLTAINYDPNYYIHDPDYINGVLLDNGNSSNDGGGSPISPGGTYRPSSYNDAGEAPTTNPQDAYDNDLTTSAVVNGIYIASVGGDPPEVEPGYCSFGGFPSVLLTGTVTLHVKATFAGTGLWHASLKVGLTVLISTNTALALADYTFTVPALTNLATLFVIAEVNPSNHSATISIEEIWIT